MEMKGSSKNQETTTGVATAATDGVGDGGKSRSPSPGAAVDGSSHNNSHPPSLVGMNHDNTGGGGFQGFPNNPMQIQIPPRQPPPPPPKIILWTIIPSLVLSAALLAPCFFAAYYFKILQFLNGDEEESSNRFFASKDTTSPSNNATTKAKVEEQIRLRQFTGIALGGYLITIIMTAVVLLGLIFEGVFLCQKYAKHTVSWRGLVVWLITLTMVTIITPLQVIFLSLAMLDLPVSHEYFMDIDFKVDIEERSEEGGVSLVEHSYVQGYTALVWSFGLSVPFLVLRLIIATIIIKERKKIMAVQGPAPATPTTATFALSDPSTTADTAVEQQPVVA